MSLINYIEPVNPGAFLEGVGGLVLLLVFAYCIYRLFMAVTQYMEVTYNRESKYLLLEESFLDKIAKEKGIDLDKEMIRRKLIMDPKRKSFRRKIEEQIYEQMFGKEPKT